MSFFRLLRSRQDVTMMFTVFCATLRQTLEDKMQQISTVRRVPTTISLQVGSGLALRSPSRRQITYQVSNARSKTISLPLRGLLSAPVSLLNKFNLPVLDLKRVVCFCSCSVFEKEQPSPTLMLATISVWSLSWTSSWAITHKCHMGNMMHLDSMMPGLPIPVMSQHQKPLKNKAWPHSRFVCLTCFMFPLLIDYCIASWQTWQYCSLNTISSMVRRVGDAVWMFHSRLKRYSSINRKKIKTESQAIMIQTAATSTSVMSLKLLVRFVLKVISEVSAHQPILIRYYVARGRICTRWLGVQKGPKLSS